MQKQDEKVYRVYPSIVAPIILILGAGYFGVTEDYWIFCTIPFIVLGSICSAPNLNLAEGFLVVISVAIGFAIWTLVIEKLGIAIVVGSLVGWFAGAIEKNLRMKPINND